MNAPVKDQLQRPMGGLMLMTFFTLIWTLIAENSLANRDHRIAGIVFFTIILIFIRFYIYFFKAKKHFPAHLVTITNTGGNKSGKWFLIIFGIEGFAILVTWNILVNINRTGFFIPCFALIVGLHFFPLAKIFKRKFDYYLASWTCLIAITGIVLLIQKTKQEYFIATFVSTGCAVATISYGIKMIYDGWQLVSRKKAKK
jgi:hypothetical protein